MPPDRLSAAFAYAWWLTGDAARAADAVRAATNALDTHGDAPIPRLLAAVRTAAIDTATMCPASELALLHDVHGLELTDAAKLTEVDVRDARTELAHGRLEALEQTFEADLAHPERLGGLTTGNPADVAHARQCTPCGEVAALLARGRDALAELGQAAPPPPVELTAPTGATPGEQPGKQMPRPSDADADRREVWVAVGIVTALLVLALAVAVLTHANPPASEASARTGETSTTASALGGIVDFEIG